MMSTTTTRWNNYDAFYSVVTPQQQAQRVPVIVE